MMKKLLLATTLFLLYTTNFAQKASTDFVTTWRTYDSGLGGDSTVVIPIDTNYTYNFDIDWDNDGVFDDIGVTDTAVHTYSDTGTYTVRIKGVFPRYFTFPVNRKLIALEQWGNNAWLNMELMFVNLDSLTYNAVDTPNLTFITSLSGLFVNNRKFNSDISNWNVSRIKNMNYLFQGCTTFNQPLANWDVSNVVSMGALFEVCRNFNQPLNNWVVDSVWNFDGMFRFTSFNQPLDNWNVENGEFFSSMFDGAPFNQPINNWDVSSAVNTSYMFRDNVAFNQPLDNWQVDSVTTMAAMFENSVFNQPLPSWNTSNVFNFRGMFRGNTVFNQDLGNWDIPTDRRPIGKMSFMLDNTNMSTANYDSTIIKWARQNEIGVQLGALGLSYCLSDSIRNDLVNNYFWTFTGDTLNCLGVGIDETSSLSEAGFSIYPNPTQGEFTLERNLSAKAKELFVYNMQGQLVYTAVAQNRKQQIDLSGFKSGIYLLRIGEESKRVVVQ
jgi:surface protein